MRRIVTEIAVVGAGPAGCVFATRMAQLGFDVCLIERARFPRQHLGESLTPGVLPMLATVGAAAAVEAAGFTRVPAVSTNWDGTEAVREDPRAQGMLADRGVFDALLLERAAATGVRVMQPAQVRTHLRTESGWTLRADDTDGPFEVEARFLADATGRSARFGGRRRATGPRTIALHGYWTGTHLPDRPRIEAGKKADVILVDWFRPHLMPMNMPLYRIAYFANGNDVSTVLVNGRVLMRDRVVLSVDEARVLEFAQREADLAIRRTGLDSLKATPDGFWGRSRLP